jgi:hypothetical protein
MPVFEKKKPIVVFVAVIVCLAFSFDLKSKTYPIDLLNCYFIINSIDLRSILLCFFDFSRLRLQNRQLSSIIAKPLAYKSTCRS